MGVPTRPPPKTTTTQQPALFRLCDWSVVGMVMVDLGGGESVSRCGVCRFLILGGF